MGRAGTRSRGRGAGAALVVAVVLMACSRASVSSVESGPALVRVENDTLAVMVPRAWYRDRSERRPLGASVPLPLNTDPDTLDVFEDDEGKYFAVAEDPFGPRGATRDALWSVALRGDGRRLEVTSTPPPCVAGAGGPFVAEACGAGDGRLDLGATLRVGEGRELVFYFGSHRKEDRVDTSVFRRLIEGVELKRR